MFYVGQACGIIATLCCVFLPLFRKKWQMLLATVLCNFFFLLNQIFIGTIGCACIIYVVAVTQSLIMLWHLRKDTPVSTAENIIFLALYVGCGLLGFKRWLDILPLFGAVFNMLAAFQRDEQKSRWLILGNAVSWASYFLIEKLITGTLSTNVFAELLAVCTTTAALIKYYLEKKKAAKE